jgi:hypothetical protein
MDELEKLEETFAELEEKLLELDYELVSASFTDAVYKKGRNIVVVLPREPLRLTYKLPLSECRCFYSRRGWRPGEWKEVPCKEILKMLEQGVL